MPTKYYSTVTRNPFLVAYWRLNDLSGTRALDWSGKYDINGIYDGAPENGPPLIGCDLSAGSKLFGTTGKNVEIPLAEPLNIEKDISIETWIVSYELEQTSIILGRLNQTGIPLYTFAEPYSLEIFKGAPIFSLGNGTNQKFITSPIKISVGTPTHIIVTCFRKNMKIFIDGNEVISGALGEQEVKSSPGNTIFIGALGNNTKRFNGMIGEVALYNGALSANKAKEHYAIGKQILYKKPYYTNYDPPSYS